MRQALQAYYRSALPAFADPEILRIEELQAGWETEIHFVTLRHGPAEARVCSEHVLRVHQGDVAIHRATREHDALRRLREGGYPVPRVHALATDDSPLDKPFLLMERVPGVPMWGPLFRGTDPDRQDRLLTTFCQLMLDLHRLDWRPLVDDPSAYEGGDPYFLIDRELGRFDGYRRGIEQLGFGPLLGWLLARRETVPCTRPGVVHWDLHPNNVLIAPDGSAVVLDWTQADVSDPRVDLGWTLILIGSEVGREWRDRILARYEELAGQPVEEIGYFEALGCFKRLLVFATVMHGGAAQIGLRPDLAGLLATRLPATRRLYERQQELTGLRIPEVERLLAND
jgi:aminoglycoside phosphotransferase (APT) family kinase protein